MSEDEYDAIPDGFADLSGVDWATLLGGPSTSAPLPEIARAGSQEPGSSGSQLSNNQSSTSYFSDGDYMDASFFAAVDRAEQQALERVSNAPAPPAGNSSVRMTSANLVQTENPASPPTRIPSQGEDTRLRSSRHFLDKPEASTSKVDSLLPRKRSCPDAPTHVSPKGKGKMKAEDIIESIIQNYEDELTCPICCDLLVAPHVSNPCGHTFCGECGWQWHVQNKNKACPTCRQVLDQETPMIPTIAMDNTVEKHVKALSMSGQKDWDIGGRKCQEWKNRKDAWRQGAAKRERKRARSSRTFIPVRAFGFLGQSEQLEIPVDDLDNDPTYDESDLELIPRPIRRARRGRRRGSGVVIEIG